MQGAAFHNAERRGIVKTIYNMLQVQEIVNQINAKFKDKLWLDFKIYKYESKLEFDNLIIAGSIDLLYGHSMEIIFEDVFLVICNATWKTSPSERDIIRLVEGDEAREINGKYGVVVGNNVFGITDDDNINYYIVSRGISYNTNEVRYPR